MRKQACSAAQGVRGSFENGAGVFISDDTEDGKPVLYRGLWDGITQDTLPMESVSVTGQRQDVERLVADAVDACMSMKRLRPPFDGGCACGAVRYRTYMRCRCSCTVAIARVASAKLVRRLRTGAMIEFTALTLLQAFEPDFVPVPTDSGSKKHWVARCGTCRSAMWNEHGTRKTIIRYVRVGTLDEPAAFPPLAPSSLVP